MLFWTGIYLCSVFISVHLFGVLVLFNFVYSLYKEGLDMFQIQNRIDEHFSNDTEDEKHIGESSKRILFGLLLSGLSMIALSLVFGL